MNICITGALGHIGSKLIRNLRISTLKTVHLVDDFLTQRYASLFDLQDNPRFVFHEIDILSPKIKDIIKDSDVVIHLAAITDAESSVQKNDLVNTVNKKGFKHVVDLASEYKKPIIFPSTTSVYGSQSELVDETCQELKPQSPYAESKIWAERYLESLGKKRKLYYIILRLGTIFGYSIGMRFHTAVNKFIFQAVNGQEITVWKTAYEQKRPYCDLDDAIAAINFSTENKIFKDNEIYNIVTLNSTVKGIISIIKEYIPEIRIKYVESKIMNQLSYEIDNSKSIKRGFAYKGNLKKSIKKTIEKLKNVNYMVEKINV
jgi:nucleoside-diphosphate-sugar epimerase